MVCVCVCVCVYVGWYDVACTFVCYLKLHPFVYETKLVYSVHLDLQLIYKPCTCTSLAFSFCTEQHTVFFICCR